MFKNYICYLCNPRALANTVCKYNQSPCFIITKACLKCKLLFLQGCQWAESWSTPQEQIYLKCMTKVNTFLNIQLRCNTEV